MQFSTARGDTNWQFHTRPVTGPDTLIDSGVAVAADTVYSIEIEQTADYARFTLYDNALVVLADKVSTTNLPSLDFRWFSGLRTLAAAAKKMRHYSGSQVGER